MQLSSAAMHALLRYCLLPVLALASPWASADFLQSISVSASAALGPYELQDFKHLDADRQKKSRSAGLALEFITREQSNISLFGKLPLRPVGQISAARADLDGVELNAYEFSLGIRAWENTSERLSLDFLLGSGKLTVSSWFEEVGFDTNSFQARFNINLNSPMTFTLAPYHRRSEEKSFDGYERSFNTSGVAVSLAIRLR